MEGHTSWTRFLPAALDVALLHLLFQWTAFQHVLMQAEKKFSAQTRGQYGELVLVKVLGHEVLRPWSIDVTALRR